MSPAMKARVIVVGGGASGLAAAIAAARAGAEVTLLERGHALGRKVLASGGGRCNLTNAQILPERFHCPKPAFIREALSGFPAREALSFFSELGLLTVEEQDGRVFPRCGKAQALLDALKAELDRLSVDIRLSTRAAKARREDGGFLLKTEAVAWRQTQAGPAAGSGEELRCDRVVLACGGASYPQLGGGESAYALAGSLGHAVTALTPALVPLCVKEKNLKRLHGLRVEAELRISCGDRHSRRSRGEVLFTDYGLSGPATLDVSREAVLGLARGKVLGSLNLFPELPPQGLKAMLASRWSTRAQRPLKTFFTGMFPAQLSGVVADALGWDLQRPLESLGAGALDRLAALLSDWRFEVAAPRPWSEAMVTAGGVSVDEVDPAGFESRLVPGLHLAGEMLDVDADSGGYNLHFAWASGLAAGRSAAAPRGR